MALAVVAVVPPAIVAGIYYCIVIHEGAPLMAFPAVLAMFFLLRALIRGWLRRPPCGARPSGRDRPSQSRPRPGTPSRPWPANRPTSPRSPPRPALGAGREAMVIDQVPPDGHGVAPPADGLDDQLAIGFAGARPRRSAGAVIGHGVGLTRARGGREYCRRVGGHLRGNGRFCRTNGRPAAAAHRHAGRLQVAAGRWAVDPHLA